MFAALEVATGRVSDACYDRHTNFEFLAFLKQVARANPRVQLTGPHRVIGAILPDGTDATPSDRPESERHLPSGCRNGTAPTLRALQQNGIPRVLIAA